MPAQLVAAFQGEWFSFDPAFGLGAQTCQIVLSADVAGSGRAAGANGCAAPLGTTSRWTIVEGQIVLLDATSGATIIALGGNQFRITGEYPGTNQTVLLERATGDPNAARVREAVATYRCIFSGFTDRCAGPDELEAPTFSQSTGQARIDTLVNLNARSQPRADAQIVGVIPTGSTIRVDQCVIASDGLWCKAAFGDTTGWFARTALRQGTWPILTFVETPQG